MTGRGTAQELRDREEPGQQDISMRNVSARDVPQQDSSVRDVPQQDSSVRDVPEKARRGRTVKGKRLRAASAVLAAWVALSPAAEGVFQTDAVRDWIHSLRPDASVERLQSHATVANFPLTAPDIPVTEEAVLTLDKLREVTFPDLPERPADADAVRYAAHQGLIQGYSDGTFRPDSFVTRAQVVTILRRAARLLGLDSGEAYATASGAAGVSVTDSASGSVRVTSAAGVSVTDSASGSVRVTNAPGVSGMVSVASAPEDVPLDLERISVNGVELLVERRTETADILYENGGIPADSLPAVEEKTDAQWAVEAGILSIVDGQEAGIPSSGNGLEVRADRASMAAYLYRFARFAGADVSCSGDLGPWPDGAEVPEAARVPLSWGMESGVFRTIVEDALSPNMPVSRGQTARLLTALIAQMPAAEQSAVPVPGVSGGGTANGENSGASSGTADGSASSGTGSTAAEESAAADSASGGMAERPLAADALAEQSAYSGQSSGTAQSGTGRATTEASFYGTELRSPEQALAARIAADADRGTFQSASRTRHAELQAAIDSIAERYHAVGLQAAVIENGRLTDVYSYGWATKGKTPMTPDHKLRIASISKVIVGMTAMRLRQDGVVDLDKPFGTYWGANFRNPYYPNTPITLRHLLTHTSSISAAEVTLTSSAVRTRLGSGGGFVRTPPGSMGSWNYNNYAFGVLGMTLEKAAGKTVDTLLDQYFFDAMDIDGSFFGGDLDSPGLIADIYSGGSVGRSADKQRTYHAGAAGSSGSFFAGGLTISVRDLGKLAALLANDGVYEGVRLLSEESVALMEEHGSVWLDGGFCQGMPLRYRGWSYGRERLYYHTGSAYGVFNGLSYDPDTKDGVVVLTSGASGARDNSGNYAVVGAIYDAVYKAIAR